MDDQSMSVDQWKKMRRKQQEVVLTVWENVLETMKFRAAGKADFGSNLNGLYGPKTTPFDIALTALKELCGTPRFFNPCPGCVFLGNHHEPNADEEQRHERYDLYYCNQGHGISKPMLIARFGDAPKPGDTLSEGQALSAAFDQRSIIGQDLSYVTAAPKDCEHPALKVARDEAVVRCLIDFDDAYKNTKTITFEP